MNLMGTFVRTVSWRKQNDSGARLRFPSVNSELNESCIRLRLSALGKSCPPARALIIALCRRYEATILICSLSTGESC